ncbi:tetratricopeptide repeat protein [Myroides sp. BIT-d1]|uniref:Tetratricopeptide repeat protein n=1 Tax=Myroides albus TaxID=2562892 RepID=A0A6I3LGQ5_9FLAO|nr:tetratricopeptide repeat protein [Myroides albus]MTG97037.1 tetratricopeptide repeat protein [Myroides albus]
MTKHNKLSLTLLIGALCSTGALHAQDLAEAKKAIKGDQLDKAKHILKNLIDSKPNEGENYYYLGDIYLQESQVDSAKYFFNQGVSVKKKGSLNYIGLGQIDLDSSNLTEAKDKFAKAEKEMRKKDYHEQLLVAAAYLNSKNPNVEEAERIAKKVLEQDYQNAYAFFIVAKANLAKSNYNEAYAAFSDAAILDPNLLEARMELAIITKRTRAFKEAINSLNEINKEFPDYAPVYREIADTYYLWSTTNKADESDLLAKANDNYKKYVSATDNSLEAKMRYAKFLAQSNNYKELEILAEDLVKSKGVNDRVYEYLAVATFNNGNYAKSSTAIESIKNKSAENYLQLGISYLKQGQHTYSKGIESLKKAVQVDSKIASSFNTYGIELFRADKFQEAIDLLSISAEVKDQSNYSYDNYYIAYCYYSLGLDMKEGQEDYMKQAVKYFDRTIASAPNITESYFFQARAYRNINSEEAYEARFKAYQTFEKVVLANSKETELSDSDKSRLVEAYNAMGAYYANIDDISNAKDMFNKTLQYEANNEFAVQTLKAISN